MVLAADRRGISFWSYERICSVLELHHRSPQRLDRQGPDCFLWKALPSARASPEAQTLRRSTVSLSRRYAEPRSCHHPHPRLRELDIGITETLTLPSALLARQPLFRRRRSRRRRKFRKNNHGKNPISSLPARNSAIDEWLHDHATRWITF